MIGGIAYWEWIVAIRYKNGPYGDFREGRDRREVARPSLKFRRAGSLGRRAKFILTIHFILGILILRRKRPESVARLH